MESKFKIGDMVTGTRDNPYTITTHNAIMKVSGMSQHLGSTYLKVIILEHSEYSDEIGETYSVEEEYFEALTPEFKVGDIICGISDNTYRVTSDKAQMKVLEVYDRFGEGRIRVEVIEQSEYPEYIGNIFTVSTEYFKLVTRVVDSTHNIVFVKYDTDKRYLFLVPEGVELECGDMVYTNTVRGNDIAECVSKSYEVDGSTYNALLKGQGIDSRVKMKYVLGRAVQKVSYVITDF